MSIWKLFSHLSFDFVEGEGSMTPEKMAIIKKYSAKFNRWDRLVLYPVVLVLVTDILVLLYQTTQFNQDNIISQQQSIFTGQILFVIAFAFFITIIRVAICKFLLLHPTLHVLRSVLTYTGVLEMGAAIISFITAIGLSLAVAILAVENNQDTALLITAFAILSYVLTLFFYRLHIAAYIARMCEENAQGRIPNV